MEELNSEVAGARASDLALRAEMAQMQEQVQALSSERAQWAVSAAALQKAESEALNGASEVYQLLKQSEGTSERLAGERDEYAMELQEAYNDQDTLAAQRDQVLEKCKVKLGENSEKHNAMMVEAHNEVETLASQREELRTELRTAEQSISSFKLARPATSSRVAPSERISVAWSNIDDELEKASSVRTPLMPVWNPAQQAMGD